MIGIDEIIVVITLIDRTNIESDVIVRTINFMNNSVAATPNQGSRANKEFLAM